MYWLLGLGLNCSIFLLNKLEEFPDANTKLLLLNLHCCNQMVEILCNLWAFIIVIGQFIVWCQLIKYHQILDFSCSFGALSHLISLKILTSLLEINLISDNLIFFTLHFGTLFTNIVKNVFN